MSKILIALLIGISVPLLLGTAQEAYAAALFLDDRVENQIRISAGQFEFFTTGQGTFAGETATFTGKWFVNVGGNPDPGNGVVYIVDACTGKVSDIITASWSTEVRSGFDRATISVTIQSSPAGADLGDLPAGFTSRPEGNFDINGSFLDPTTGARVGIPSNLGIRFMGVQETCIVEIDIKPGSDPNSINTKSKGVVPVAILGSATFDVTDVDVTTLAFGPSGATPAHDLTDPVVYASHLQDVNSDGFTDLVSHYKQKETGIACGDTEATLTGNLLNATPIEGTDSVRPVPCK